MTEPSAPNAHPLKALAEVAATLGLPQASLTADYYPRIVACCDQPSDAHRGGGRWCGSCGAHTDHEYREALFGCPHGNEIALLDSGEVACLDCGLRWCQALPCEAVATRAGNGRRCSEHDIATAT